MNRRIPLAPSEGWITLGLVVVMGLSLAWAIDDARWVLGRSENLDLLVLTAIGGVLAGFIGPKVGWGRWQTYLIGSIFAALLVPLLVGMVARPNGASIHDLYVTTADVGRPGLHRPGHPQPAVHLAVPPLHLRARDARLGDLHVRVVRGVRPSPPAQRRDRGRDPPRREHGVHPRERAPVPRPVQHRLVVPAHPLARLRRAGRMAPAPDRRSVDDLVGLPARRDRVHHGRGHLVVLPDPDGGIRAAGRRLGRRRGRPPHPVAIGLALPADGRLDPPGRAELREQHAGPAVVELRPGRGDDHPARPERHDRVLLARLHLRPDRPEGLGPDQGGRDRRRRGPADPGRACRQPRHDGPAQLLVHGQPGEVPPADDDLAGDAGERQRERQADDRRDLGLLRHARAQRRPGRVQDHRDGRRPRQRPRSAQRVGPRGGIDDVPGRHQGAVPDAAAGAHARDGRSPARGQDPGRGQVRRAV